MDEKALEGRNEKGQFLAGGHGGGRPLNSMNRVTRFMRDEFARVAEELGDKANPLVLFARCVADEKLHISYRLAAAAKLASYIAPQLLAVEKEPNGAISERAAQVQIAIRNLIMSTTEPKQIEAPHHE